MAKKVVTLEVCDQCGKEATTYEIVIGLPGQPAKVFDLCLIDYEALLAITGGSLYSFKKGKAVPDDELTLTDQASVLQAATEGKAHKRNQVWEKDEDQFLVDNPLMSHQDVAEKLNRTFFAIRTRRAKLRAEGHVV